MVKNHPLLVTLSIIFVSMMLAGTASAWEGTYHLNQEWVKIWIKQNGTIDLFYNISITLKSGDPINYVEIGQPRSDFTTVSAIDQNGHPLETYDIRLKDDYKVRAKLYPALTPGQTIWFTLLTNVAHMIWEDTQDNVGMQFTPSWYDADVLSLRVLIVLPPNVTIEQVKTTEVYWNGTLYEGDRLAIYWEKQNLAPKEQFPVGVSFPKKYVQYYDTQPSGLVAFFQKHGAALLTFGFFIAVIGAVVYVARKKPYLIPRISMETLGIRRGLTAVEASYLLDMKPTKIVTEILYSLLHKRAIWVESTNPSLKLKIMQPFQDKTGTREKPLRYYERDFLKAIKKDGTLDEEKLAQTVMLLRDTVEQKIRGYCRRDTIDYYRKIVAKAWEQVEQAGTPELASKAYDEQLLWLLLNPNYQSRTQTTFHDRNFEPSPFWLWYWYSYQHYHPNPTYKPNIETPTQSAKPPTIPGADFANNIATAVENTSNNIVANLEKFANAIIPMPTTKSSTEPARHGASCVCACASCACVCACVSCACACASGGVG
ncbi:MAG: hypothetical protein OEY95_04220 [Candidatus Bathyarchaeota archaeon]|nr:hypothetical protein [Candidatus Bathyarchaeota archaeon]MDH5754394.1 hypothetical protein [Candidatus Bathyarchaeota archaeon]